MKQLLLLFVATECVMSAYGMSVNVQKPGDLPNLISEAEKFTVTELKVTGKINGTDMLYLREMAGVDYDGYSTDGSLAILDLSDVEIVEGGDSYAWDDFTGNECYAEDNTIGQSWFCNCLALRSIILPQTATVIGQSAFYGCASLETVVIGDNIRDIGEQSFCSTEITNLDIPDGVEEIQSLAFADCPKLRTVHIGTGLKGIDRPFIDTPLLENIFVDKGNPYFQDSDGVMTYDDGKVLMIYPNAHSLTREYTIPESVEMIFSHAFYDVNGMDKIYFGSETEYVGPRAFEGCSVQTVRFNKGLEIIDEYSFLNSGISEASLPSSLKKIGASAFFGCESLKQLELSPSLVEIGSGAFGSCHALETVVIPDEMTVLGDGMFAGASSLTSLHIGVGIRHIPEHCFSDLYALESLELPGNIETIGNGAFSNCTAMKHLTVAEIGLKTIENGAFAYCSALESFDFPTSLELIGTGAFSGCSKLKELFIPNQLTVLSDNAFSYCEGIESVKLGDCVEEIGNGVFSGCSSLTAVEWNKRLRKIGSSSFSYCENLSLGTFPSTLEQIGDYAFSGLEFKEILLPESVKSIGSGAFGGWSDTLEKVTCLAKVPPTCGETPFGFYTNYETVDLYVPEESMSAYKTASVWKEFRNMKGISGLECIQAESADSFDVYSVDGRIVLKGASKEDLTTLRGGIYIIDGKKFKI